MNTMISLASSEDVKSVGILYDNVNEYFEKNINYCYPNWQKGKYPTIADAPRAFEKEALYVLKADKRIAGSVIIDNIQHPEYKKIPWTLQIPDEDVMANDVMTIHTLAVEPDYRNHGIGESLIRFSIDFCKNSGAKTIRLDTHYKNIPARRLYEKCGFKSLGRHTAFVDNINQEFDVFEYIF